MENSNISVSEESRENMPLTVKQGWILFRFVLFLITKNKQELFETEEKEG
jgi:hypothetical protein